MNKSTSSPISPICPGCSAGVNPDIAVCCDGCEKPMHFSCLGLLPDEIAVVSRAHKRSGHVKLLCSDCNDQLKIALYHHYLDSDCIAVSVAELVKNTITSESEALMSMIGSLKTELEIVKKNNSELLCIISKNVCVSDEIQVLRREVENLKCSNIDLIKLVTQDNNAVNVKNNNTACSYASKVITDKKIIVKPKNAEQSVSKTRSDLLKNVNIIEEEIAVTEVKPVSKGGLLISCNDSVGKNKFKDIAADNLSENYNI